MKLCFTLKSHRRGFTLIELLVVVAIISLLSSIILASLKSARDKAKASSVVSAMIQIKNAAELYRNDKGSYPPSGTVETSGLVPNYLPVVPKNSLNSSVSFYIQIENSGSGCGSVSYDSSEIENGKLYVYASHINGSIPKGLFKKYYFETTYGAPYDGNFPGPIIPCVE